MKKRVIVAMSGGVDSSVAAYLLKEEGFEVIGVTMHFGITKNRSLYCQLEGIGDAKRVCEKLGIRHYVLNFFEIFEEKVVKGFVWEYFKGRTPNPCVRCNQFIKFGILFKKIKEFSAQYLATGHYARIVKNQKFLLKKAEDRKKDQSYFLYRIKKEHLPYIIFPLGGFKKEEVKEIAEKIDLSVAEKSASQEICFIQNRDYYRFISDRVRYSKQYIKPGPILDKKRKLLGFHKGIPFYTIGQRQGLNISNKPGPFYVISIDSKKNEIVVGTKEDTKSYGLIAGELNFISSDFPKRPVVLKVKIRYNHKETEAKFSPLNDKKVKIIFKEPQFAVTPGQSVVFYDRDTVLGGGIIEKNLG